MDALKAYIQSYTPIPASDWQQIQKAFSQEEIQKGSLILEAGQVCRHLYFLEKGFLRYFTWQDGDDITRFFTQAPYIFTAQRSYNLEIPCLESIQALEDSVVWKVTKAEADQLLQLPSWSTFIRKLIQEVQFFTEQILDELQNLGPEERYHHWVTEGHTYLEKVPLKYLASYLGIAPQSLSRIRKRIMEADRT
ncbi:MAG: cyclic nucleotide-binding domain-containing protein [Bacteroidota bacterium]